MRQKITLGKFIKALLGAFSEHFARESANANNTIDPIKQFLDEKTAYEMTPKKAQIYDPRLE